MRCENGKLFLLAAAILAVGCRTSGPAATPSLDSTPLPVELTVTSRPSEPDGQTVVWLQLTNTSETDLTLTVQDVRSYPEGTDDSDHPPLEHVPPTWPVPPVSGPVPVTVVPTCDNEGSSAFKLGAGDSLQIRTIAYADWKHTLSLFVSVSLLSCESPSDSGDYLRLTARTGVDASSVDESASLCRCWHGLDSVDGFRQRELYARMAQLLWIYYDRTEWCDESLTLHIDAPSAGLREALFMYLDEAQSALYRRLLREPPGTTATSSSDASLVVRAQSVEAGRYDFALAVEASSSRLGPFWRFTVFDCRSDRLACSDDMSSPPPTPIEDLGSTPTDPF